MQNQDVRQQGPDAPKSWVFDVDDNRVDRYEPETQPIRLMVTLSGQGRRTIAEVKRWYWEYVGWAGRP